MDDNTLSLQLGQNIISPNDPLKKISIDDLHRKIKEADNELRSKIQQLRIVQSIEPKRYQALKKMLPYVTCGIFNPPYRRSENFASIRLFILDIDHLSRHEMDLPSLRERLKNDNRIHLMFVSPGNDGLKLVFYLEEKCYDAAKYSIFYKLFVTRFAAEHNLANVVDKVTSDVTRACFLSFDEDVWYNPFADAVNMSVYIDFDSYTSVNQAGEEVKQALEEKSQSLEDATEKTDRQELPPDVLQQIKEKLNPNIKTKIEKIIFVPEELIAVVNTVEEKMNGFGIKTKSVESIHYGKKFVFELDNRWAQLNLFFGKKGFKIVKTPANGSNDDLAEVTYKILCEMFY
jgi:hypothetical protein